MKLLIAIGAIPLSLSLLMAQEPPRSSNLRSTTWNGTLVDANCQNTYTVHKQSSTTANPDQSVTTRTETTRTETACPATAATTTFGILTRDGRYIPFDESSNARVAQMFRDSETWNRDASSGNPVHVRVVGTPNGNEAVVESMVPEAGGPPTTGEAARLSTPPVDESFDVRYHNDRGRLVIGMNAVRFEDLSNGNHSRTWTYAEIKELKREPGKEIKIRPYSGDKYELHLAANSEMSDAVYNMIADRIVAARSAR